MFADKDKDNSDHLEIPAFLRRRKGEPQDKWTPPTATAPPLDYNATLARTVGEEQAAVILREQQERAAVKRRAGEAKRKARPSKEYLVGMIWDVVTAQFVPDHNASPSARGLAMDKFSKPQSVRSNARRAARALGVDVSKVVGCPSGGFYFPLPNKSAGAGVPAHAPEGEKKPKAAKTRKAKAAKTRKPAKAKRAKTTGKRAANGAGAELVTKVAAMLRRAGGAPISGVIKATGWLTHTARARISVNVGATLKRGEMIHRYRKEKGGESWYAIVASKQLDLPGV